MQVIVKGRHTDVPDDLKILAIRKVEKVRRFFDRIQTVEIEFSEEHNTRVPQKHSVEVTLTTKGHLLRASATGPDPASAVDVVVDKLEAQVKRLKGKIIKRGRRHASGNGSARRKGETPPHGLQSGAESDGEVQRPRITRELRVVPEPMTPEEAALRLELLGQEFSLFLNAESGQCGVVYRRADGSFGLIEPA